MTINVWHAAKAETPAQTQRPARSMPMWVLQLGFYLSFFLSSALCMITAVYDTFVLSLGQQETLLLCTSLVLAATFIGPKFRRLWASRAMHVVWATALTALCASVVGLTVTQLAEALVSDHSLKSLLSLPMTFAVVAFLMPVSLYATPQIIVFSVLGSVTSAYFARRITRKLDTAETATPATGSVSTRVIETARRGSGSRETDFPAR